MSMLDKCQRHRAEAVFRQAAISTRVMCTSVTISAGPAVEGCRVDLAADSWL